MIIDFPKPNKPMGSKSPLCSEKHNCPACGRKANPPVTCRNKICDETWVHLEQDCPSCKACWIIRLVDENCNKDTGVKCNTALTSLVEQEKKALSDALDKAKILISQMEDEIEDKHWFKPMTSEPINNRSTTWVWFAIVSVMIIIVAALALRDQGKTLPKSVDRTEQTR